jgi:DNA replication protein DnaC
MLTHPVIQTLKSMRLNGMVKALQEQLQQADIDRLGFEERLGFLVDREQLDRQNRQLQTRLRKSQLKQSACLEDIDYHPTRELDRTLLHSLASCQWTKSHHHLLIVGPTGTGKTFLACALAHKACLEGYSSYYARINRLLPELAIAKGDGQYTKKMQALAKIDVLILDDFGLTPFNDEQRRDLLELLDDRHEKRSCIVTSQLPIKLWHETIGNGTLADAILDRLIHTAYRIEIKGDSMRKKRALLSKGGDIQ